ncbi:relaxase/mobilization nuclease domain-containing protein [Azospirillum sp. A1-3]|uniref:relaxase/mobilization nuclease domain-containing protein n=1 Tax=Azospirillum sp. A1-3 TaxID=185874 RepID=UPI0020777EDB|nr:relaxase/mobilization nuclease domain-containing protein [Azospirillum sp. A1-3]MCM8738855.1 relaxase/mobilization nuclease domain-containing protein [Azospirillum sp. A1-3]
MTAADDKVWRLPTSIRGQDVRLAPGLPGAAALSADSKARLRRIANKAPEAMVKIAGRAGGGGADLHNHLAYITRQGRLSAETQDGERIGAPARLDALIEEWLLANAAEARGANDPSATQAVALIVSMPPGTPPDPVEAAARAWAQDIFARRHDWVMVRHDDTGHPHVHITVRAVGHDGRRLAPGPGELQRWRERFAGELRRCGLEAEATPRLARGRVRKPSSLPTHKIEQRGLIPRAADAIGRAAVADASAAVAPEPPAWSHALQLRHEAVREAYLRSAELLEGGDVADRQLARDLRRFVADLPNPLPRRHALALALRAAQDRAAHPQRSASSPPACPGEPGLLHPPPNPAPAPRLRLPKPG